MDHFTDPDVPDDFAEILDRINHPDVPTLYGPLTEFAFLGAHLVAPGEVWALKLILIAADMLLVTSVLSLTGGRWFGRVTGAPAAAVLVAWCPLCVFETAFNAHPEALAVSLAVAALVSTRRVGQAGGGALRTGVLAGLSVASRIPALLSVPFILWRSRPSVWLVFIVTLGVCYAPFWLQGSLADLSGLLVFGSAWEFNSSGHAVLAWWFGPEIGRLVGGALFGFVWLAIFAWFAAGKDSARRIGIEFALLVVYAAFFLLSPVFNPWYALWLVPFVALRPTGAGVTVLAAVSLSYLTLQNLGDGTVGGYDHPDWLRPIEFGLVAIALAADGFRIVFRSRRLRRAIIPHCEHPTDLPSNHEAP